MMDPVALLNQSHRHGGISGSLLSSVSSGRVLRAYSGVVTRCAPHHPNAVVNAVVHPQFAAQVEAAQFLHADHGEYINSDHVVSVFNRYMTSTYTWAEEMLQPQVAPRLDQIENTRIQSLVDPPPIEVSGRLQYVFRVGDSLRGVAAVARAPAINVLVARCLVGMETIASVAQYEGPFFAVAFNGTAWCTLERPAGYERGRAGLQIQRRDGNLSLRNQEERDAFIVNLRRAWLPALDFEYS